MKSLPFMTNDDQDGDDPACKTGVSLNTGSGYRCDLLLLSGVQGRFRVEYFYKL